MKHNLQAADNRAICNTCYLLRPLLAILSLSACNANSFSDRPAILRYAMVQPSTASGTSHTLSPAETERATITAYHASSDLARDNMGQRAYRNAMVYRQLAADDDDFNAFVQHLRADRALMNLSTDGGAIILSGIAAVAGSAGEKAALATLSGGLLGIRNSFDKELFALEAMSALLSRMRAARTAALVPIKRGLATDIDAYPFEQALLDLRAYSNAGSLSTTIDTISTDAGTAEARAAEQILSIERDTVYRDSRATVDSLLERITKLTDSQSLGLAFAMERYLTQRPARIQQRVKAMDAQSLRLKNGSAAKAVMKMWLQQDEGSSAELGQWTATIGLAEKG